MNEKHFKILQYLNEQGIAIRHDNFPQQIKTDFQSVSLQKGSLHFELDKTMKDKGLVKKSTTLAQHFEITPFGKEQLQEEIERQNKVEQNKGKPLMHIDKSIKIGDNFSGALAQDSDLSNARLSPTTETNTSNSPTKPPKRSVLEIITWIVSIVAGIFAIYEFIIKKFLL